MPARDWGRDSADDAHMILYRQSVPVISRDRRLETRGRSAGKASAKGPADTFTR